MLAFLTLSIASLPRISHIPWEPFASEHAHGFGGLAVGISIALWNYIGWDNPSTAQGEVKNPSRTYPRALAFALPLVTIGYFVPLLTTLGATDWTTWAEGGWPQIAASAAGSTGRWIAIWVGVGGMISALALFNALLLGYSRIPFVLAEDGLLPKALARLDAYGTPRTAVIVSAVFYSLFAFVAFGKLIVADVLLYSVALFLEFAALIQLRRTEPSLRGVFRIPLGCKGVAVLASLPMIILLGVICVSFGDGEYGVPAVIGTVIAVAAGPLMYRVAKRGSTC
jgi:amino acid transporter